MRIHRGDINHLSVSLPPRAGKSYITSLFCAWVLGNEPTESVMRNTCTARLYEKFSYDVRAIVKSDKYREVFTDIELSPDKQSVNGWNLTESRQVGYFGAGLTGTIIGFGATKLAITDDMYKSLEDALSDNTNEKVLSWEESAHESRTEGDCARIDIGTRWRKTDLIGRNMERGEYDESIVIPALDENGETFCADVKTTKQYQKIKSKTDSTVWDAEYMQQPVEAKGLLFAKDQLRYFKPDKAREFDSSIAYADIADEGDDALSCPNGRNVGRDVYITDVVFNTENSDITMPLIANMLKKQETTYIRVESNAMGSIYARELEKIVPAEVYTAASTTNKHTRILTRSALIRKHFIFLHEDYWTDEYEAFMKQLFTYLKAGGSKHDDAADSLAGLWDFIYGILGDYYDEEPDEDEEGY